MQHCTPMMVILLMKKPCGMSEMQQTVHTTSSTPLFCKNFGILWFGFDLNRSAETDRPCFQSLFTRCDCPKMLFLVMCNNLKTIYENVAQKERKNVAYWLRDNSSIWISFFFFWVTSVIKSIQAGLLTLEESLVYCRIMQMVLHRIELQFFLQCSHCDYLVQIKQNSALPAVLLVTVWTKKKRQHVSQRVL